MECTLNNKAALFGQTVREKCPITGKSAKNPVTVEGCPHLFDSEALGSYLIKYNQTLSCCKTEKTIKNPTIKKISLTRGTLEEICAQQGYLSDKDTIIFCNGFDVLIKWLQQDKSKETPLPEDMSPFVELLNRRNTTKKKIKDWLVTWSKLSSISFKKFDINSDLSLDKLIQKDPNLKNKILTIVKIIKLPTTDDYLIELNMEPRVVDNLIDVINQFEIDQTISNLQADLNAVRVENSQLEAKFSAVQVENSQLKSSERELEQCNEQLKLQISTHKKVNEMLLKVDEMLLQNPWNKKRIGKIVAGTILGIVVVGGVTAAVVFTAGLSLVPIGVAAGAAGVGGGVIGGLIGDKMNADSNKTEVKRLIDKSNPPQLTETTENKEEEEQELLKFDA